MTSFSKMITRNDNWVVALGNDLTKNLQCCFSFFDISQPFACLIILFLTVSYFTFSWVAIYSWLVILNSSRCMLCRVQNLQNPLGVCVFRLGAWAIYCGGRNFSCWDVVLDWWCHADLVRFGSLGWVWFFCFPGLTI